MSHVDTRNLSWTNIILNEKKNLEQIILKNYVEQSHILNTHKQKADENLSHVLAKEVRGWPYKAETVCCLIDPNKWKSYKWKHCALNDKVQPFSSESLMDCI